MTSAEGQLTEGQKDTVNVKLKLKLKLTKSGFVSVSDSSDTDTQIFTSQDRSDIDKLEKQEYDPNVPGYCGAHSNEKYHAVSFFDPGCRKRSSKRRKRHQLGMGDEFSQIVSDAPQLEYCPTGTDFEAIENTSSIVEPETNMRSEQKQGGGFLGSSHKTDEVHEAADDVLQQDLSVPPENLDVQICLPPNEAGESENNADHEITSVKHYGNLDLSANSDLLHITLQTEDLGNLSEDSVDSHHQNHVASLEQSAKCSDVHMLRAKTGNDHDQAVKPLIVSGTSEQFQQHVDIVQRSLRTKSENVSEIQGKSIDNESPDLFYVDSSFMPCLKFHMASVVSENLCSAVTSMDKGSDSGSFHESCTSKDHAELGTIVCESTFSNEDGPKGLVVDTGSEINNNSPTTNARVYATADVSQAESDLGHVGEQDRVQLVSLDLSAGTYSQGQKIQKPYQQMLFNADFIESARENENLTNVTRPTAHKSYSYIDGAKNGWMSKEKGRIPVARTVASEGCENSDQNLRQLFGDSLSNQPAMDEKIMTLVTSFHRTRPSTAADAALYRCRGVDTFPSDVSPAQVCSAAECQHHTTNVPDPSSASKTCSDKPGPMSSKRCRCMTPFPEEFPDEVKQTKRNWMHKMCGKCLKRISISKTKMQTASSTKCCSSRVHNSVSVYSEHNYCRSPHEEPATQMSFEELNRRLIQDSRLFGSYSKECQMDNDQKSSPGRVAVYTFPEKFRTVEYTDCGSHQFRQTPHLEHSHAQQYSIFRTGSTVCQNSDRVSSQLVAETDMMCKPPGCSQVTEHRDKIDIKEKTILGKKKQNPRQVMSLSVSRMLYNDFVLLDAFRLDPCYVVLERLPSIGQDVAYKQLCLKRCRAESLEFLCEYGKLKLCKNRILNCPTPAELHPEPKRLGKCKMKRDFLRHNKTLEGYEEYRQQQLQSVRLKRMAENGISKDNEHFDTATNSMGVFFPLSSLCVEGSTDIHLSDSDIKVEQHVVDERQVHDYPEPHIFHSDAKQVTESGFADKIQSLPPEMGSDIEQKRNVLRSAKKLVRKSTSKDIPLDMFLKPLPLDLHVPSEMDKFGQMSPDETDNDQLKISKFDVKYHVFEADGRAFMVPLIKTSSRPYSTNVLDQEDLKYVKEVISLLLDEKSSCARLLGYRAVLEHKQKSKGVSRSGSKDSLGIKPLVIGMTAEEFHVECLSMVATDPEVLNMIPENTLISRTEYLQQIGDEVFRYLAAATCDAHPWIKELAKKVLSKHKKRTLSRKRLKPSKDITIEIDYAVEDVNIDVGEEKEFLEASFINSDVPLDVSVTFTTGADAHLALNTGDAGAYLETSAESSQTELFGTYSIPATQKTGSFVSDEAYVQEKKMCLADLRLTQASAGNVEETGEVTDDGPHIVTVPQGFDSAQHCSDVFGQHTNNQVTIQHAAEYAARAQETFEPVNKKPMAHELLSLSAVPVPLPAPSAYQTYTVPEQHKLHVEQYLQLQPTTEQNLAWPYAVVKQEPQDDDYPCSSSVCFSNESLLVKQENCDNSTQQEPAFPFLTNAMFDPGVVEHEKEASSVPREVTAGPSSTITHTQPSSNQQPELSHLSPWMVPDFDKKKAFAGLHNVRLAEMRFLLQTEFAGQPLELVPDSHPVENSVDSIALDNSVSTVSCNPSDEVNKFCDSIEVPAKFEHDEDRQNYYGQEGASYTAGLRVIASTGCTVWSEDDQCSANSEETAGVGLPVIVAVSSTVWSEESDSDDGVQHSKDSADKEAASSAVASPDAAGIGSGSLWHFVNEKIAEHMKSEPVTADSPDINVEHISVPLILPPGNHVFGKSDAIVGDADHAAGYMYAQHFGTAMVKQEAVELEETPNTSSNHGGFPALDVHLGSDESSPGSDVVVTNSVILRSALDAEYDSAGFVSVQDSRYIDTSVKNSMSLHGAEMEQSLVDAVPSSVVSSSSSVLSPYLSLSALPVQKAKKKHQKKNGGWSGTKSSQKQKKAEATKVDHLLPSTSNLPFPCNSDLVLSNMTLKSSSAEAVSETSASSSSFVSFEATSSENRVHSELEGISGVELMFDSSHETDDEVDLVSAFSILETLMPDKASENSMDMSGKHSRQSEELSSPDKTEKLAANVEEVFSLSVRFSDKEKLVSQAKTHSGLAEKPESSKEKLGPPVEPVLRPNNQFLKSVPARHSLQSVSVLRLNETEPDDVNKSRAVSPAQTGTTSHIVPSAAVTELASQVAAVRQKKKRKPAKKRWGYGKKSRAKGKRKSSADVAPTDSLPSLSDDEETLASVARTLQAGTAACVLDASSNTKMHVQAETVPSPPKKKKGNVPHPTVKNNLDKPQASSAVTDANRVTANLNTFLAKLQKTREVVRKVSFESKTISSSRVEASLDAVLPSWKQRYESPAVIESTMTSPAELGSGKVCSEGSEWMRSSEPASENSHSSDSSVKKPRERSFFDCLPHDFLSAWKS